MEIDKWIALMVALFLDLAGIICGILSLVGVGALSSFVVDLIGALLLGVWAFLKVGETGGIEKGVIRGIEKAIPKIERQLYRFAATQITEIVPLLGDLLPTWTIFVLTS